MLYTKFQSPTMPGTCQKVCVGCGSAVFKPIFVFGLGQAEQFDLDTHVTEDNKID